jgi:hypothetical protein
VSLHPRMERMDNHPGCFPLLRGWWTTLAALPVFGVFLWASATGAASVTLTQPDAQMLLRAVRAELLGQKTPDNLPESFRAKANTRVVLSAYRDGGCRGIVCGQEDTLLGAAQGAARQLVAAKAVDPKQSSNYTLTLDIIADMHDVKLESKELIGKFIDIGAEGLAVTSKGQTRYFTPLAVLLHASAPTFLEALYGEGEPPPVLTEPGIKTEAFSTVAYVEQGVGQAPLALAYGNVLLPDVTPAMARRAYLTGANWMLRMQTQDPKDGHFVERYDPLADKRIPGVDVTAELQAAETLLVIYTIVADAELLDAANLTIEMAKRGTKETGGAEVPSKYVRIGLQDEFAPTVALLKALCTKAAAVNKVEELGLMEQLGNFIAEMTSANGSVYLALKSRLANEPPPDDSHGAAEEAIMALCGLAQCSPTANQKKWLILAERIAKRQITVLGEKGLPDPRLVEALGRLYVQNDDRNYARQCILMAGRLKGCMYQQGADVSPMFVGGIKQEGGPVTRPTALSLKSMVFAWRVATLLDVGDQVDAKAIRAAGQFVADQQYRAGNSFYLRNATKATGAWRAGVRELTVTLAATRDAVEAMVAYHDFLGQQSAK